MLTIYLNEPGISIVTLIFGIAIVVLALLSPWIRRKADKKAEATTIKTIKDAPNEGIVTQKKIQTFNRGYFFTVYADHTTETDTGDPTTINRHYYVDPETYNQICIGDTITVDVEKEELLTFEHGGYTT